MNVYGFVANDGLTSVDILGREGWKWNPYNYIYDPDDVAKYEPLTFDPVNQRVFVNKCEIIVLFGHGSISEKWKWKLANGCNAAGVIMCWPGANSTGIPEGKDLQNPKPEPDGTVFWGPVIPDETDESISKIGKKPLADKIFTDLYDKAAQAARDICKDNCCKRVRVRFFWRPKGKEINLIENPTNKQTQYGGPRKIQNYEIDCVTGTKKLIPR